MGIWAKIREFFTANPADNTVETELSSEQRSLVRERYKKEKAAILRATEKAAQLLESEMQEDMLNFGNQSRSVNEWKATFEKAGKKFAKQIGDLMPQLAKEYGIKVRTMKKILEGL